MELLKDSILIVADKLAMFQLIFSKKEVKHGVHTEGHFIRKVNGP